MPDIQAFREEINLIDTQIADAFQRRMNTALEIAKYKQENGLPVFNLEREQEVMARVLAQCPPELTMYAERLYQTLFDVSRSYQQRFVDREMELGS